MTQPLRVLIVEDSEEDTFLIMRKLRRGGFDPTYERVETPDAMRTALDRQAWDIIIADYTLPHFSAIGALNLLKETGLDLPFIIVSDSMDKDITVAAMKAGAHDYLVKGDLKRLIPAIERELGEAQVRLELKRVGEAVKERESFLNNIFSSIQDSLTILDLEFNILGVNPVTERRFQHAMPLIGKKCYKTFYGRTQPCEVCAVRGTIETGKAAYEVVPRTGENGKIHKWLDLSAFPLIDMKTGKVKGAIEYVRDITEQRRMEEEKSALQERLLYEQKEGEKVLKRSEESAKRLAQENAVIAEIGRIVSSTLDIDGVYERFAERLHKLVPFDRIAISLINPDSTQTIAYSSGVEIPDRRQGERVLLEGTVTAEIIRRRQGLILQGRDQNEIAARVPLLSSVVKAGFRSMLSVPLISKDEVIGALHFRALSSEVYTEDHLELAQRVGNQIAGAIANARLFGELMQAEKALKASEEKFRELYDHAPVGYHEYDIEGRITNVNTTDLEMLGYTREEMIGRFMWEFNAEEEAAKKEILEKSSGLRPPGQNLERTYIRKDGTTIPVLIENRLLQDEKGGIRGVLCTVQDIRARKRAEQERDALEEQLRESQKMEAIGQLAGGIAHDFNNLLTIIKGYSQLSLTELREDDPVRANIDEIKAASDRAGNLTRQLLAFSRRQVLEMKVVDLNTVLHNLEKMLRRIIGEDIELVTSLAEDLGRVKIDPGQIEQVVMNLAINARDAMPAGGKLTIETGNVELDGAYAHGHVAVTPGRYVMIVVSDIGMGMTPEVKERIFEPFFTTKEKGKGTGLGLSTVYGIVKQSGGHIWVYSESGRGTTFKIYLPRVDEPLEESREKPAGEGLSRGTETILVVEDEDEVRKLAVRILLRQGYTVLNASSGGEALSIASEYKSPIHLMVTDVVMPGMGGCALAESMGPLHPETKVIYMSGYTDDAIVHHGILDEGTNYIQKPFTLADLVGKVREVLDK